MRPLSPGVRLGALALTCIVIVLIALITSGANPAQVLTTLLTDSFRSPTAFADTLKRFCPYMILGVAVFWALRAGLFNIGVEGQFLMGGMTGTVGALQAGGMGGVLLGAAAGMVAGAAWALPAAWIRAYRGGHEVISTIMLNMIAFQLSNHLVSGPIMDPDAGFPTTRTLGPQDMLSGVPVGQITVNWALVIAFGLVMGFGWWLRKTVAGYELSVVGANPTAGSFAGIDVKRTTFAALLASGALAGFGGGLQAVAFEGRFYMGFSTGYGFDALGVAILAGGNPIGIIPSAFAYGLLQQGALAVQTLHVPPGIATLILSLLVVLFSAIRYGKVRHSNG